MNIPFLKPVGCFVAHPIKQPSFRHLSFEYTTELWDEYSQDSRATGSWRFALRFKTDLLKLICRAAYYVEFNADLKSELMNIFDVFLSHFAGSEEVADSISARIYYILLIAIIEIVVCVHLLRFLMEHGEIFWYTSLTAAIVGPMQYLRWAQSTIPKKIDSSASDQ